MKLDKMAVRISPLGRSFASPKTKFLTLAKRKNYVNYLFLNLFNHNKDFVLPLDV